MRQKCPVPNGRNPNQTLVGYEDAQMEAIMAMSGAKFSIFLWLLNGCLATELMSSWYVTPSGAKMITYYGPDEECEIFATSTAVNDTLRRVYRSGFEPNVQVIPDQDFERILDYCDGIHAKLFSRNHESYFNPGLTDNRRHSPEFWRLNMLNSVMIFPGTKWCGVGSVAKHNDDLGYHEEADRCCR